MVHGVHGSGWPAPAGGVGGANDALPAAGGTAPHFDAQLNEARGRAPAAPPSAPRLVPAVRTTLTGDAAASALRVAWNNVRGQAPREPTLAVLVAQWAHETGRGSAMLNFNFGGIKGTSPSGYSAVYATREGHGASEVRLRDRFRAYGSAAEGATDYVDLLVRRYPDAIRAAEAGDPAGFVSALERGGYFTGDPRAYTRSVEALARQALSSGYAAVGARTGSAAPEPAESAAMAVALAPSAAPPRGGDAASGAAANGVGWSARAFSDEVARATLLISALRLGDGSRRDGA